MTEYRAFPGPFPKMFGVILGIYPALVVTFLKNIWVFYMEIIKYCNKAIINYTTPGHYYDFSFGKLDFIVPLPHSEVHWQHHWSHLIGNSCRHDVYSGQYLACILSFALFLMTSSDIPHKKMGMQKTVEGKGMTFYYLCQSISNTPGSICSYLLGSNTLCLLLESCLQMVAYHR